MSKKKTKINVEGTEIAVISDRGLDYISLTDMVRNFEGGSALIEQWLKNKDTVLFLGAWEKINNPDFNSLDSRELKIKQAETASFYRLKNGRKVLKRKAFMPQPEDTAGLLRTATSRLSSDRGLAPNSSFT